MGWDYNGVPLIDFLLRRTHAIFAKSSGLTTSTFEDETLTAARFGIIVDPDGSEPGSWFTLPRASRAIMVAQIKVETLNKLLLDYESTQRLKR